MEGIRFALPCIRTGWFVPCLGSRGCWGTRGWATIWPRRRTVTSFSSDVRLGERSVLSPSRSSTVGSNTFTCALQLVLCSSVSVHGTAEPSHLMLQHGLCIMQHPLPLSYCLCPAQSGRSSAVQ